MKAEANDLHPTTAQEHVFIADMTARYAQINIQGPRSRDLLQTLTSADVSNNVFPFRAAKTIDLGLARVLCCRITYVGELGYELFIPLEQARHVYDCIVTAGQAFDLTHAGLKSLGSLRMVRSEFGVVSLIPRNHTDTSTVFAYTGEGISRLWS